MARSGPRRDGGDSGLSDEERRRHADARRFARLLVSEILLYNEEAVMQGRRHRDLGRRLEKVTQSTVAPWKWWMKGAHLGHELPGIALTPARSTTLPPAAEACRSSVVRA